MIQSQLVGRWDAIYVIEGKSLSESLIKAVKESKVEPSGNHNELVIYFTKKTGGFKLMSIRDYAQGDEKERWR